MRLYVFLLTLSFLFSLLLNIKFLRERDLQKTETFRVIEVIDGDTFKINSGGEERRVRLIGINAPEIGRCLGIEAKEKLSELVLNKQITLKDQFTDPYGRIMANVYTDTPVGGEYINRVILLSGLGRLDYYENPQRNVLKEAYGEARNKKLGIFSGVCISKIPPVSPESGLPCDIKGNVDDNTKKKYYYLPSCRNYSQVIIDLSTEDTWFCSEDEAVKAGFVKSKTCN